MYRGARAGRSRAGDDHVEGVRYLRVHRLNPLRKEFHAGRPRRAAPTVRTTAPTVLTPRGLKVLRNPEDASLPVPRRSKPDDTGIAFGPKHHAIRRVGPTPAIHPL